jgi:hypothetical protein
MISDTSMAEKIHHGADRQLFTEAQGLSAGPNHVLPTARTARFSSALGVYDSVKRTSIDIHQLR